MDSVNERTAGFADCPPEKEAAVRLAAPISISVVSHRHGDLLPPLLSNLAQSAPRIERVWITHDVPETEAFNRLAKEAWPFEVRFIVNPVSRGFGANHNTAFAAECSLRAPGEWWWGILNPDLRWRGDLLAGVQEVATWPDAPGIGLVYPVQLDARGSRQDHERSLPTPGSLLRRHLGSWKRSDGHDEPERIDWVNAACIFVRSRAFAQLGGFDERYRLYVEDVDLCLRLRLDGYRLARLSAPAVQHDARRASRRHWRHALWHLQGLVRLWLSAPYRQYRKTILEQ